LHHYLLVRTKSVRFSVQPLYAIKMVLETEQTKFDQQEKYKCEQEARTELRSVLREHLAPVTLLDFVRKIKRN